MPHLRQLAAEITASKNRINRDYISEIIAPLSLEDKSNLTNMETLEIRSRYALNELEANELWFRVSQSVVRC
ncbi:hypothetical protein [Scytonema sp. NUACC26]|uniref:hypothetical protein n=1 Tax=Scytonema sp. NUACC26 TaxID=3140176 RepID=UPI0034DBD49C